MIPYVSLFSPILLLLNASHLMPSHSTTNVPFWPHLPMTLSLYSTQDARRKQDAHPSQTVRISVLLSAFPLECPSPAAPLVLMTNSCSGPGHKLPMWRLPPVSGTVTMSFFELPLSSLLPSILLPLAEHLSSSTNIL